MKKQSKGLDLSKRTISNLNSRELSGKQGGGKTQGNGKTCQGCQTNYCTYGCPGTRTCF